MALGVDVERLPPESFGGAVARLALAEAWASLQIRSRGVRIPDSWRRDVTLRRPFYERYDAVSGDMPAPPPWLGPALPEALHVVGILGRPSGSHLSVFGRRFVTVDETRHVLLPHVTLPVAIPDAGKLIVALPPLLAADVVAPEELSRTDVLSLAHLSGLSPGSRGRLRAAALEPPSRVLLARYDLRLALRVGSSERARQSATALDGMPGPEAKLLQTVARAVGTLPPAFWSGEATAEVPADAVRWLTEYRNGTAPELLRAMAGLDLVLLLRVGAHREEAWPSVREAFDVASRLWPDEQRRWACVWSALGERPSVFVEDYCPCPFSG
jgi:hypothetical protein